MSKTYHRHGGKFGGSHTTLTEAAVEIADLATKCPHVTNVSPGVIVPKNGGSGQRRVKICDAHGYVLLKICGSGAMQEVRVYTGSSELTKAMIAKGAQRAGVTVTYAELRDTSRAA